MSGPAHIDACTCADGHQHTDRLQRSANVRALAHTQLVIHTRAASVLWRVGVRTCSVLLTRPDEMPNCKTELGLYRFYKMAGYARLCGRSHVRLAECVRMHVAQRYVWAGNAMRRCAADAIIGIEQSFLFGSLNRVSFTGIIKFRDYGHKL